MPLPAQIRELLRANPQLRAELAKPLRDEPLTPERLERLLDARAQFPGDDGEFFAVAGRVRAALIVGRPEAEEWAGLFDGDAGGMAGDFHRLLWLHSELNGCETLESCRIRIDAQREALSKVAAMGLPGPGPGLDAERLGRLTDTELVLYLDARQRVAAVLRTTEAPRLEDAISPADLDARAWLSAAGHEMANERFDGSAEALSFVDELYAAGATRVVIAAETLDEESGTVQAMKVGLPGDESVRLALFSILNREIRDEGFDEVVDTGQESVALWWD